MGAQQTKSDDELLNCAENSEENLNEYIQKNNTRETAEMSLQQDEQDFNNPLEDTVIPDQYHTLLPINENDSHNSFSVNSSKNTLTVAAFAKIKREREEEINSVDGHQSYKIKQELLTENSNPGIENCEKEDNFYFEANNNVEISSEHQSEFSNAAEDLAENLNQEPINDNFCTENVRFESNNIEKTNDLLIDNSCLDEITDVIQKRVVKVELLESHGVQVENSKKHEETFGIDEPCIEEESNLSTQHRNQYPLNIEVIPNQIKRELNKNHDNENLNTISQNSDNSIINTANNFEKQSQLVAESIIKDPLNVQSIGTNTFDILNTTLLDTDKQASQNNDLLLNKDNNIYSLETDQQLAEIKTEIGELQIQVSNKDSTQENNSSNQRFLKENSNDPLIIKAVTKDIILELDVNDFADKKGTSKESPHTNDFVKNPFAFLKNLYKQKKYKECNKKTKSPNGVIIKSEIFIDSDEDEIELTGQFKTIIKSENDISKTKETSQALSTNNELIIKTESLTDFFPIDSNLHSVTANNWDDVSVKTEQIQENYQLPFININDNDDLSSSLEVNVDNLSTQDLDEQFFLQSNDDKLSNSTVITSPTSSEYHSVAEILSLDDIEILIPKSDIKKNENKLQEKRRGRPIGSKYKKIRCDKEVFRGTKTKSGVNSEDKTYKKREKPKRKPKKSTKYTEHDSAFRVCGTLKKNLPKPTIITRTKETTNTPKPTIIKNSNLTSIKKAEFPKPFKLEMDSQRRKEIAVELPRPMVFKNESITNTNETQFYKTPEFQPCVRLKRLKSEELLVPYKTRKIYDRTNEYKKPNRLLRRSYPFVTKSTTQNMGIHQYSLPNLNQRQFLIQKAYSLNPQVKLNRWSMDQDNPFVNNSHLTTSSYGMPSRSSIYRQSKYFTSDELHKLFQSSPSEEKTSLHSEHFDSGVSSSTPKTSHATATRNKDNNTLLLEIAAERAFINNHLLHFGFSPIHFELFNNVDDLNVFLKYLFGQLNNN